MMEDFTMQQIINLRWSLAVLNSEYFDVAGILFSKITKSYNSQGNNEVDCRNTSTEGLNQLHQVLLWYEENEKNPLLPPKLRKEIKLAFIANEGRPSELQKDILKTFESLESLGIVVVDKEIHCNQTGYSLDIVIGIKNSQKEMVVEIDGPSHFIAHSPNGATALKRRQLNSLSDRALLSIPYWEWDELSYGSNRKHKRANKSIEKDDEKKRKQLYLQECLRGKSFL
mmetsp:Transcript_37940/g.41950  ORF Transcript_37940/g.41950 Transcript_37940/m.41950 type:complete len:227 (-) Transcript_37940:11-691(-)